MVLGDFASVVPYALGGMVGFVPGWISGRADWGLRLRYWRNKANRDWRPLPPYAPSAAATTQTETTPTPMGNRTEEAA